MRSLTPALSRGAREFAASAAIGYSGSLLCEKEFAASAAIGYSGSLLCEKEFAASAATERCTDMKLTTELHRLSGSLAGLVFGPRCQVCAARRATHPGGTCDDCSASVPPPSVGRCPRCAVKLGPHVIVEKRCTYCRTFSFYFNTVRALYSYTGLVRRRVHAAKFKKQWTIANRLVQEFCRGMRSSDIPREVDLIVPVPMFWFDRRRRGVHLSAELVRALAGVFRIEHSPGMLMQLRPTRPQYGLTAPERFANVEGLFRMNRDEDLSGKTVLLIDDVMTTGATSSACARVLKKAGAKKVHVAVLARTEPPG